ncbi:MAG: hypothetical protein ABJB01_05460 [Rudaea sp.]
MSNILEQWQVQEHGAIDTVSEGLLTVEGTISMPLGKFPRRMTVASLSGGGTAIFSAIALAEPAMQQIEALGAPTYLVVPNAHHRMDAKIWRNRYPTMKVIAPSGARESVGEVVAVDDTELVDRKVSILPVAGTAGSELAMIVSRGDETTLVLADIIAHVAHPEGLGAKVMAMLMGFGVNHPQIPSVVKHRLIKDKAELAGQFRQWAALPGLKRIIPGHGDIISQPKHVLETLADALET